MPVVPPRPFPVTSGPSLVRPARAGQTGRGCRPAGRARLTRTRRAEQDIVKQRVRSADGLPGRVLAVTGDRPGADAAAGEFLGAARGAGVGSYELALRQMPFQARGGFTAMLDALLARLRAEARAAGTPSRKLTEAIARVFEAREQAQGNVNPQLLTAVLSDDLAGV